MLGLCFAVFYGWCLALVLRGLYSPTAAGDFCGTPGVLALTFGAVLFSPAALLLVAAIVLSQIPFLGCLVLFIFPVIGIAGLIVTILCIVKATQGSRFLIPGVSDFANKF